jgi:hypothetical protein
MAIKKELEKAPIPQPKASKIDEKLSVLKKILDLIHGKEAVSNRLGAILDPKNPKSSSNLTAEQVNFVIDASFAAKTFPNLYGPLAVLVDELVHDNLSLDGWGVNKAISLTAAIEQSKLLQGTFGSVEEKKSRFPSFRKGEVKQ